jgi:hypothetical protein
MWVRVDDAILDNPKILRAGLDGFAMYVAGLVYSARALSDGFIPEPRLSTLLPWRNTVRNTVSNTDPVTLARKLVHLKLWRKVRDGYRIHDYLQYNPSRDDLLKRRQDTAERVRRFRRRHAVTNAVSNDAPVPYPSPNTKSSSVTLEQRSERTVPSVTETQAYIDRLKHQEGS